jgi:hypothetical protein
MIFFTNLKAALRLPTPQTVVARQIQETELELLEAHTERENSLCRADQYRAHIDILETRLGRLQITQQTI